MKIEKILDEYPHRIAANFKAKSLKLPVYELGYKGNKIALIQAGVGAPIAGAQIIEDTFAEQHVSYIKAKTWTTDAFYRETPLKNQQRKKEERVTVEMETSAYIAVP